MYSNPVLKIDALPLPDAPCICLDTLNLRIHTSNSIRNLYLPLIIAATSSSATSLQRNPAIPLPSDMTVCSKTDRHWLAARPCRAYIHRQPILPLCFFSIGKSCEVIRTHNVMSISTFYFILFMKPGYR